MTRNIYKIFKKGSRTYFYSSLFFPSEVREDVFKLYAFVRVADDFVDSLPQRGEEFGAFKDKFEKAWGGETAGDEVIDGFVEMAKRRKFEGRWIKAFLRAMEADLGKANSQYAMHRQLRKYMYGSAEVIGLMMAAILLGGGTRVGGRVGGSKEVHRAAKMLGRAMQYVNFIRDIREDKGLGRIYLPGLPGRGDPDHDEYIRRQLDLYFYWQAEAEKGFGYLPRRYRVAVKTASDMYKWTAGVIYKDPQIVYARRVKPSVWRVVAAGVRNWLTM